MERGDIIRGRSTLHPIVFLGNDNEESFEGCIITHANSENYNNNVALQADHFLQSDENGNSYLVQYDNTYIVGLRLIKYNDWGPFRKCGKLSDSGIEYIENILEGQEATLWDSYINE